MSEFIQIDGRIVKTNDTL